MFSKNEPRPSYNPEVLKEAYNKADRTFTIYTTFNPSLRHLPLSGKFYSIYQQVDLSNPDQVTLDRIKMYRAGVPKQKYEDPITDNQIYGWHSKPLMTMLRSDYRFNKPRVASITKIQFIVPRKK